eukprot:3680458-Alexandrium_andersonii.AAC.1
MGTGDETRPPPRPPHSVAGRPTSAPPAAGASPRDTPGHVPPIPPIPRALRPIRGPGAPSPPPKSTGAS